MRMLLNPSAWLASFPNNHRQASLRLYLAGPAKTITLVAICSAVLSVCLAVVIVTNFPYKLPNGDEATWYYIGLAWQKFGAVPYVGTLDNKAPGIHLLYRLGIAFFGETFWPVRISGWLSILATAVVVRSIGLRCGLTQRSALLSASLFVLLHSWKSTGVYFLHSTETFLNLFNCVAVFLLLGARTKSSYLLSGVFFGLALFFRQSALVTVLACCVYIVYPDCRRNWGQISSLVGGATLATVALVLAFAQEGFSLPVYFEGAWLSLFDREMSMASGLRSRLFHFVTAWASDIRFLLIPMLAYLVHKRRQILDCPSWRLILLWFVFDWMAANVTGYTWSQQLRQILPSLCLLIGYGTEKWMKTKPVFLTAAICSLAIPSSFYLEARHLIGSAWNGTAYLSEQLESYLDFYDRSYLPVVQAIRDLSPEGSPVFVFSRGHSSFVMSYSGRPSTTQFFNTVTLVGQGRSVHPQRARKVQNQLQQRPPALILVRRDATQESPYHHPAWLKELIAGRYTRAKQLDEWIFYQLRDLSGG